MNELTTTTPPSDRQIAKNFAKRLERGIRQFNKFYDVKYWTDGIDDGPNNVMIVYPFALPLRFLSGHFALHPYRRNIRVSCNLKYTPNSIAYYEFCVNADIGVISVLTVSEHVHAVNKITKRTAYSITDIDNNNAQTLIADSVTEYVEQIQKSLSEKSASIGKNLKHSEHMLQICALLVENPNTDLNELARTFTPEQSIEQKEKQPLGAIPLVVDDTKAEIDALKDKLTTTPTDADIVSFGTKIGHALRASNKAVTDWRQQNGLDLPISFQLHKRLVETVSGIASDDIPAKQKLSKLQRASTLIDRMIEHLPKDQATVRQDMEDNGKAKAILLANAEIAGMAFEAFNSVAPDLKSRKHMIGQEETKTFSDTFIDDREQDLRLMRHTYGSKQVGHDQIETPALMAMAMNLNKMGTVLDLIIDNIESARREITAENMVDANKILYKMATRVTTMDDIVTEAETVMKAITDGTSSPLQITHQPLGGNGDSGIQLAHVTRRKKY